MPDRPPHGVLTALVTCYGEDGEIDKGAQTTLIDFQLTAGVDGLFILGTSGEGLLLSPEERTAFTELALQHVASRAPLVVHTGAPDTRTATTLTRQAAQCGAESIAALPPLFFPYPNDSQLAHFTRIAESAPDADLYVYDNPERTGYPLGPTLVTQLIRDIPNLRGLRASGK